MVRTQFQPFAFRFDPSRILALSTAIALHLLALLLLLIPLSRRDLPPTPRPPSPRWILPVTVPTPPVPIPITQAPTTPAPPVAPVHPVVPTSPVAPPLPLADAANQALPASDAAPAETPTDIGPAQATAPSPGATLQYLRAPAPAYPRPALLGRLQGTVLLQVHVDVEGRPVSVEIAQSSGHRLLDQAARDQVLKHWRFRPAQQDGQAVEAIGLVPVAFTLAQ